MTKTERAKVEKAINLLKMLRDPKAREAFKGTPLAGMLDVLFPIPKEPDLKAEIEAAVRVSSPMVWHPNSFVVVQ